MSGMLGIKSGMSQVFEEDGRVIPVTLLRCPPNTIAQIKTEETHGYNALVLGVKPLKRPAKTKKFYRLKEVAITKEEAGSLKKGDSVTAEIFKEKKEVEITGTSKGKGFQGTIKRYHFSSGPGSHGSHFHREPGAVGPRARMGKLHKGKKLPGRMGCETVTVKHAPIVKLDLEKNLLALKGPVPGPNGGIILIKNL